MGEEAETGQFPAGLEVVWYKTGKRSFCRYSGTIVSTEDEVATIRTDTGRKVQVAISELTRKQDEHPDALWLLAYGGAR